LRDKEGKDLAERINDEGDAASYWHLDVAREKEVRHIFEKIHERFGRIDILVNNAGIAGATKPTYEITEEEWDHVQAVNVKGVFFCTKHAIPFLRRAGGGSIINLSSIYGLIGALDVPPNRSTVMTGSRPTR
jgi:NAD(P)-dependent dehydrogenase (short-subunit alcohol dehydrogenase family)